MHKVGVTAAVEISVVLGLGSIDHTVPRCHVPESQGTMRVGAETCTNCEEWITPIGNERTIRLPRRVSPIQQHHYLGAKVEEHHRVAPPTRLEFCRQRPKMRNLLPRSLGLGHQFAETTLGGRGVERRGLIRLLR